MSDDPIEPPGRPPLEAIAEMVDEGLNGKTADKRFAYTLFVYPMPFADFSGEAVVSNCMEKGYSIKVIEEMLERIVAEMPDPDGEVEGHA